MADLIIPIKKKRKKPFPKRCDRCKNTFYTKGKYAIMCPDCYNTGKHMANLNKAEKSMKKKKKKCKYIRANGDRCKHDAVIFGYCTRHSQEATN